jgi:cobalamin biosynthesis Mg chelatase CobN
MAKLLAFLGVPGHNPQAWQSLPGNREIMRKTLKNCAVVFALLLAGAGSVGTVSAEEETQFVTNCGGDPVYYGPPDCSGRPADESSASTTGNASGAQAASDQRGGSYSQSQSESQTEDSTQTADKEAVASLSKAAPEQAPLIANEGLRSNPYALGMTGLLLMILLVGAGFGLFRLYGTKS